MFLTFLTLTLHFSQRLGWDRGLYRAYIVTRASTKKRSPMYDHACCDSQEMCLRGRFRSADYILRVQSKTFFKLFEIYVNMFPFSTLFFNQIQIR